VYQDAKCTEVISATGFVNDNCLSFGPTESESFDYPNVCYYLGSPDCQGSNKTCIDISPYSCLSDTSDDYYGATYDTYYGYGEAINNANSDALSTGAVAGIAVGAVVGVGIIGGAAFFAVTASAKGVAMASQGAATGAANAL
jgi:hypothetical protein